MVDKKLSCSRIYTPMLMLPTVEFSAMYLYRDTKDCQCHLTTGANHKTTSLCQGGWVRHHSAVHLDLPVWCAPYSG